MLNRFSTARNRAQRGIDVALRGIDVALCGIDVALRGIDVALRGNIPQLFYRINRRRTNIVVLREKSVSS